MPPKADTTKTTLVEPRDKTVVVEPLFEIRWNDPGFKEFVAEHGELTPEEAWAIWLARLDKARRAVEWLESDPLDNSIKELDRKLTEQIDELKSEIFSFHDFFIKLEVAKAEQKAIKILLWLILLMVIYMQLIAPIIKAGANLAQAGANAIKSVTGQTNEAKRQIISRGGSADAQKIVSQARQWVGKDFKAGQSARCADFVRAVFRQAGISLGVTRQPFDGAVRGQRVEGPLMARSFFGSDVGQLITNKSQLRAGDLVAFANTYGSWPQGSITHVGIYVGNGMMIDRPTAAQPVRLRSISAFTFSVGVRPSAYRYRQITLKPSISKPSVSINLGGTLTKGDRVGNFRVSSPYGNRVHPVLGTVKFHNGVDVAAPQGTPLYVIGVKGERVKVSCNYSSAGGNQGIMTSQKTGITAGAAHMVSPCRSGTYTQGQQFGAVGNTGRSTGAHLHLTQRTNGDLVNPQRGVVESMLSGRALR